MKKNLVTLDTTSSLSVQSLQNKLLASVIEKIESHNEIKTFWKITNVMAVNRLAMTDHGIQHFNIVANNSLTMTRLLKKAHIELSITKDYNLTYDYGEIVVFLASVLHDVGMSVHRVGHEEYSLFIVHSLLKDLLDTFNVEEKTILTSEVLHAIISHRSDGKPLTIEAGIVRVADALDMSKGRTRFPYEESKINIHSVSALAIDDIEIKEGKKLPIQIAITMNHTAGLFQIDELLQKKVLGSGLENFLEIEIYMEKGKGKELFKTFYKKS